jgi:mRNA interferase MazF
MDVVARRFEVFLIRLDPAIGSEIPKTRPCLIISPDEMNTHLRTLIVAPKTTQGRARLVKRLGKLTPTQSAAVLATLAEMFVE